MGEREREPQPLPIKVINVCYHYEQPVLNRYENDR